MHEVILKSSTSGKQIGAIELPRAPLCGQGIEVPVSTDEGGSTYQLMEIVAVLHRPDKTYSAFVNVRGEVTYDANIIHDAANYE